MQFTAMRMPGLPVRAYQAAALLLALPPAYTATALLLLGSALFKPALLSPMLLLLILRQAAPLGLAALGQSLVMRSRSLDLSAGGIVSAIAYLLTSGVMPLDEPLALLLCLLLGAVVGAINGWMVVTVKASSVIVTLSVSMMLTGTVIALSQFHAPGDAPELLREFGRARLFGVPWPLLAWCALLLPAAWLLRRSVFGRTLDAIGANPRAAALSGLPHLTVVFITHVVSGLMSALSGLLLLGFVGVGSVNLGSDLALNSLAAAILGGVNFGSGKGGLLGPAVAAFMLAFLFNFLTSFGLGEAGRLMLQGALIALAALAYSLQQRGTGTT